ncbi:hypothetical protein GOBAR_AA14390 [Gossypium barbadense]|uniref:PHD-type domain-containing protein n=1 Tax=Gossypium barbadense TaxID=3634 RepID=A0A2P5XSD0_GOSBA|nr:hypothetical protein GOBAR_AA14390 [Gossypium barbadense]
MAVNQMAALKWVHLCIGISWKDLAFSHTSNTYPPCLYDCSSQPLLTIPEEHIFGYGVLLGSYAAQNIVTSDCQLRSQNEAPLAGTGLLVTSENMNGNRKYTYIVFKYRAPQVYFVGDNVKNLKLELAKGAKLKCSRCGLKGAALGCYVKSCHKSYHFPCAKEIPKCRWDYVILQSSFQMKSLERPIL